MHLKGLISCSNKIITSNTSLQMISLYMGLFNVAFLQHILYFFFEDHFIICRATYTTFLGYKSLKYVLYFVRWQIDTQTFLEPFVLIFLFLIVHALKVW